MDRYFSLSPAEQAQYLDEQIDRSEKMKQAWQKKGGQGKGGAGKGGQAKGRPPGGGFGGNKSRRCEGRPAAAIAGGDSEPAQAVSRPDVSGRTSADGPVPQGHGRSPQAARLAAADVMPSARLGSCIRISERRHCWRTLPHRQQRLGEDRMIRLAIPVLAAVALTYLSPSTRRRRTTRRLSSSHAMRERMGRRCMASSRATVFARSPGRHSESGSEPTGLSRSLRRSSCRSPTPATSTPWPATTRTTSPGCRRSGWRSTRSRSSS